jgi:hypothetical protein
MSLPIISAAQERDLRGDYCLAALLRSFVSLLAACPQKSGVTALILARFYISTSRRFHCCGYWFRKLYRPLPDSHSADWAELLSR